MNQKAALVTGSEQAVVPLDRDAISRIVREQGIDLRTASIREMTRLVDAIEKQLGLRFIRMEFGIPGLRVHPAAIEAEIQALRELQVAHVYAPFDGVPALKEEAARFVELFMGVKVPPSCCVPTIGAMEGCFASLALAARLRKNRGKVLFLDPGFPVNRLQARFLGLRIESLDFYDHRGEKLLNAVERLAERGDVCAVLWSSPNNPSWITLKEPELEGLGRICDRHGIIAIEDLAYFGMDVRRGEPRPGQPPYQPTVLRYTRRGISLISSSKMFSYAGQRIAIAVLSPELAQLKSPDLLESCGTANVGHAFSHGVLYPIAACVPESPQYGLLALFKAANAGDATVFEPAREYSRRAKVMKRLFLENGFRIVYDNDLGEPIADGFYFTISHPAYESGVELVRELLHFGVSAITLETAGSCRKEGLRACVSLTGGDLFDTLGERLRRFREIHPA
jgi:aspartate/methionine/tyrosine aminotransferase